MSGSIEDNDRDAKMTVATTNTSTTPNQNMRRFILLACVTAVLAIVVADNMINVILRSSSEYDYDSVVMVSSSKSTTTSASTMTAPTKMTSASSTSAASTTVNTSQISTSTTTPATKTKPIVGVTGVTTNNADDIIDETQYLRLRHHITEEGYNEDIKFQRRQQILKATIPWSNLSTVAFYPKSFYSGFRNQIMAFHSIVMYAYSFNYSQILLNTIIVKDTFGSNRHITFEELFDVPYWNTFYESHGLPRLVHCNQDLLIDYNCSMNEFSTRIKKLGGIAVFGENTNATKPYILNKQESMFRHYKTYSEKKNNSIISRLFQYGYPNPIDLVIKRGALRPHHDLQQLIDNMLRNLTKSSTSQHGNDDRGSTTNNNNEAAVVEEQQQVQPYMTLHARVEPDMIKHNFCTRYKEVNLTRIFTWLEEMFPYPPPAKHIFMPINRQYMEKEGYINEKDPNSTLWIAVENLIALNSASQYGLWNQTVKVFEFGANALKGTKYEIRPSTTGALINFYIAINSKVFIGTPVSSYSHDLLTTRFYRGIRENYKYVPEGIIHWTPQNMTSPPGFVC